ncbi:hypothetical protein BO94DRAFT_533452 [Aspergillus sclerotioniger CBS 115572]|uniref:Uncharacterized protein n=1 Tax=Aspergillus sclerotioniger CBS 115572 TaxID=1450535 RepID=A0A317WZB4_9EURO|nr:hypothetical protein BO94DRAFT_533452 [Aspergillus sclerotioniger CBS 115572]PWY91321.1 hypothetical protein BO94DRAFT_533452 [Aspergillus sclerotioniger CBS 115572]
MVCPSTTGGPGSREATQKDKDLLPADYPGQPEGAENRDLLVKSQQAQLSWVDGSLTIGPHIPTSRLKDCVRSDIITFSGHKLGRCKVHGVLVPVVN